MKKIIKIIFINLLIFLIAILLLEYISYKKHCELFKNSIQPGTENLYSFDFYKNYFWEFPSEALQYLKKEYRNGYIKTFREATIFPNNNPPILIFGCSFAYGYNLSNKETLSYKLGNLTKTTTLNFGITGAGIQHMFYLLSDKNFFNRINKISPPPKYAIYLYFRPFNKT